MLEAFLNTLVVYLDNGANCRHLHEIKQKELFFIFRFYYSKENLAAFFAPIIGDSFTFKKAVLDNYTNISSVKELAKVCNYSISSFHRQFKAVFNNQPSVWLQGQKLQIITKMLADPRIQFCNIVDEFGFSSASHFTVFCKIHLGMTPTQYRKKTSKSVDSSDIFPKLNN
jgi:AraC-like DNA-binding protein